MLHSCDFDLPFHHTARRFQNFKRNKQHKQPQQQTTHKQTMMRLHRSLPLLLLAVLLAVLMTQHKASSTPLHLIKPFPRHCHNQPEQPHVDDDAQQLPAADDGKKSDDMVKPKPHPDVRPLALSEDELYDQLSHPGGPQVDPVYPPSSGAAVDPLPAGRALPADPFPRGMYEVEPLQWGGWGYGGRPYGPYGAWGRPYGPYGAWGRRGPYGGYGAWGGRPYGGIYY